MGRRIMLDRIAVVLSGACLLHCLLLPIVITLVPIVSVSAVADEFFHRLLLLLILPTSLIALLIGCARHRSWVILGLGVLGLSLVVSAAIWGHGVSQLNGRLLTSLGGVVLAISHILNYRRCRELRCPD